ncbi:MAG TPA: hypothetical protein VIN71_06075 [Pseudomonadales bacterium]
MPERRIPPRLLLAGLLLLLAGCTTAPPSQTDDVCDIFREKRGWYKKAAKARDEWGSGIHTMMAFIHQESRFVADARPPRKKYLGFIPGPRLSSAYGYPQAKKETWRAYQRATGNYRHDRDDFGDALMFIGWYNDQSQRRNQIAKYDTEQLYLAYHEGHGGYARGSYRQKPWLQNVAKKVADQGWRYKTQLDGCEKELKKRRRFLGIF